MSHLDTPGFGNKRRRLEVAEKSTARYPAGTMIPVHYNPDCPEISRLRVGPSSGSYLQLTFGFVLYMAGLFMIIPVFRRRVIQTQ